MEQHMHNTIAAFAAARRLPADVTQETIDAACHLWKAEENYETRRDDKAMAVLLRARERYAENTGWLTDAEESAVWNKSHPLAA